MEAGRQEGHAFSEFFLRKDPCSPLPKIWCSANLGIPITSSAFGRTHPTVCMSSQGLVLKTPDIIQRMSHSPVWPDVN